jgi:hypothetical protein
VEKKSKTWLIKRYPGESWTVDCRVKNIDVNVTLWQKTPNRKMIVDGTNLRMKNNTFIFVNISSFAAHRSLYYCEACGKRKFVGGFEITIGMSCQVSFIYI